MKHCIPTRFQGARGFTLLELLIVVAIIGILSSFALPAYQNGVQRGGRAEGHSALLQVASDQERFFNDNNSYSTNAQPLVNPVVATRTSDSGLYSVSVAACTGGAIGNCFIATATPQGSQASDSCANLTLTNTGLRGASGGTTQDCWN